jgi:hypothetical protein
VSRKKLLLLAGESQSLVGKTDDTKNGPLSFACKRLLQVSEANILFKQVFELTQSHKRSFSSAVIE